MAGGLIEHTGIIQNINKLDKKITVNLQRVSACSSCHVKSVCTVSDSEQKTIEILGDYTEDFSIGEKVKVISNNIMGMKAMMIGYFFPFLIFFITLIISNQFMDEASAGLMALGIIVPYYIVLMLFRGKLKNTFTFKIMKL